MTLTKFITEYWAQIAILLGAAGYLLKVILDYKYKRKEIWYSLYSQKKIDSLLKFQEAYNTIESELLGLVSVCKTPDINPTNHPETDILHITQNFVNTGRLLSQLRLFLEKPQLEVLEGRYIEIGKHLKSSVDLLKNEEENKDVTTDFSRLYSSILTTIEQGNRKLENIKFY